MHNRDMPADDSGFSLIEVLVALVLLAIVLLGAERAVTDSMEATVLAKEHSVANGLITQAMAEAVAIPFQDLEEGLNPNATCPALGGGNCLASDPYLVQSGSSYQLKINGSYVPSSSYTVPTSNSNSSESPIVPEVSTVTEGIPYTVYVYPTVTSSSASLVTVVAVVSWHSPHGITKVIGEDSVSRP